MKKLIALLIVAISIVGYAQTTQVLFDAQDTGGEKPFPYGSKIQFPWPWVEGCWRSNQDNYVALDIKTIVVGGEKKIRVHGRDKRNYFTGVGSVKKDTVSFLRIVRTPRQARELIHLRIGAYCLESDKTCKKALGLSLIYDTQAGLDQEDHILDRANENTCPR